jgi:hypothetical protein
MINEKLLQLTNKSQYKNRVEFLCFCIVAFLVLSPLLSTTWFQTLDGAAHSYNAGVLYRLIFDNNTFLEQHYSINTLPSPNWLGHILLAFFNEWFGVANAAKIVHLLYAFGLVFAFRWLMFVVSPMPRVMSYLIFPLVLNVIFLLGFYNFCLGVVVFLLGITAWVKYSSQLNWRNIVLLTFLFTLGWFSHQLTWFYTGVFVFTFLVYQAISGRSIRKMIKPTLAAFIGFFPSLVCWVIYTAGLPRNNVTVYQSVFERLDGFLNLRFATLYSNLESPIFGLFINGISILIVIGIYRAIRFRKDEKHRTGSSNIVWIILFVLSFLAVLIFPEEAGAGGIFGIRVEWLAWIVLLVLVSQFHFPVRWGYSIAIAVVVLSLCRNVIIREGIEGGNKNAHAAAEAGKYIRDRSTIVVFPVAASRLSQHIGEYAIAGREVALLSNYEADQGYFPVGWEQKEYPYRYTLASIDQEEISCGMQWKTDMSKTKKNIDYVMIVGDLSNHSNASCAQKIIAAMDSLNYQAIYKKREFTLYEYKPR